MKYVITGGAGVNFAEKLVNEGHQVVIVDNLSRPLVTSNLDWILNANADKISFSHLDIRCDIDRLNHIISECDVVFHLAGQVAVTTSVVNPREDFEINALGTFNVLEAIRLSDNNPILIFSSTNKVYGGMEDLVIVESDGRYEYRDLPLGIPEQRQLDFHSPYGCSKGAADQYVRDYSRIFGIRSVVMRQSCIYGTRQFGVEDQGWVAWFIIASMTKKDITIFGNGKQIRDILFVDDLYSAFRCAVDKIDIVNGEVFNVGGGHKNTLSLLELLDILQEKIDSNINYSYDEWRPGDQPVYVSDISHIEEKLNWAPEIDVKNGVDRLVKWVEDNISLF